MTRAEWQGWPKVNWALVSLVAALLFQGIALAYSYGGFKARLDNMEFAITRLEHRLEGYSPGRKPCK